MPYWINDSCIDCGACVGECPVEAIEPQRPPAENVNVTLADGTFAGLITAIENLTEAVQDLRFNNIALDFGKFRITLTGTGQNLEYS